MVECAICLGPIVDECRGPCEHAFCRECILGAISMKAPEWSGSCPLCRGHLSVYSLRDASGSRLAKPAVSSPFGSVFVQSGGLGAANYHFDAEDDCYISYAAAPSNWLLSDGNAPLSKKQWNSVRYESESRTFHGTIEWDPPFGTDVRWDYEIVFSEDFVGIVGGRVVTTQSDGSSGTSVFGIPWEDTWDDCLRYLRWMPPPSTPFGSVYLQGRSYSGGLEGIASYHFESESSCYISYSNAPPDWLLDDGSLPPARKPFTQTTYDPSTRTFTGTIDWLPAFSGAVRWEYTITFAEDFGCIVAGHMRPFRAASWFMAGPVPMPVSAFGDPRQRATFIFGRLYYVLKPTVLTLSEKLRQDLMAVGSPLPKVANHPAVGESTHHVAPNRRLPCVIS